MMLTSTKPFFNLRGTETCCGFGKLSCSTYEFEYQSAKCPRTFLKSLSRINQSSMHSETVEQGKPACCCATTWRLSPSTSRNQIPTRGFTERPGRIWRARKTFSKPFFHLKAFRFPERLSRPPYPSGTLCEPPSR